MLVALSNFSMYYTWRNIKRSYKNTSAPTRSEKVELPDRLYSPSDIKDYLHLE